MSIRRRSRILALFLSLLPGWGQIYWGHETIGLALFTFFAGSLFLLGNGFLVILGGWQDLFVWLGATGVALSYLVGVGDVLRRSSPRRIARENAMRDRVFREGVVAYLKDEFDVAERAFRRLLAIDPVDVEALFRLAVVSSRRGDDRRAASWMRKLRRFDVEGKWNWEVEGEERRLRERKRAGTDSRLRQHLPVVNPKPEQEAAPSP